MVRFRALGLAVFAALLVGCTSGGGSGGGIPSGDLGGVCWSNGRCREGLVCDEADNTCIAADGDLDDGTGGGGEGADDGGGDADATGGGGESGDGSGEEASGSIAAGRATYAADCQACHGTPGRDDGEAVDLAGLAAAAVETGLTGADHESIAAGLGADDYADLGAYLEIVSVDGGGEPDDGGAGVGDEGSEGEGEGETPGSDVGEDDPGTDGIDEPEPDPDTPDDGTDPDAGDPGDTEPDDPPVPSDDAYADFSVVDANPNSPRFEDPVSPRDYLEQVSAWYFGHST